MKKILSIILAALSFFLPAKYMENSNDIQSLHSSFYSDKADDEIAVHFIDVGQGDCEFIELPYGKTMLIDAGNDKNGSEIISYINSMGYDTIDYVIATHPHSDHIGGMAKILNYFNIGEMYIPDKSHTTKTFEAMLDEIEDKKITLHKAKAGVNIFSDGSLKADILAPISEDYDSLNNYSAVVKITYGKSTFLFTGDAEKESEEELLKKPSMLDSDILKAGHHGSSTSSDDKFIEAVSPDITVISCGKDNSYGHPHSETLSVLKRYNSDIYRTDESGTIIIKANDSGNYEIMEEK